MLKTLALAGIFMFASAVSTAAVTSASQKRAGSSQSAPTAPQAKGFCYPVGVPC
jgi:hypothetical protein